MIICRNNILRILVPIVLSSIFYFGSSTKEKSINFSMQLTLKDSNFCLRFINDGDKELKLLLGNRKVNYFPMFVFLKVNDSGYVIGNTCIKYNWDYSKLDRKKNMIEIKKHESYECVLRYPCHFELISHSPSLKKDSCELYIAYSFNPREKFKDNYMRKGYFIGNVISNTIKINNKQLEYLTK